MKKVLLIGANGGMGCKVAQILLDKGYEVIGTYFSKTKEIEKLNNLPNFSSYKLDIGNKEEVLKLKQELALDKNSLYAVVNCSGIVDFEGSNLDKDLEIWEKTIDINLSGNYYLAKNFYDTLMPNGRFVMISSTDAYYGGSGTAAYAASKAGVNSLAKSLSLQFKDKKIRVNAIAPGWVSTPMIEGNSEQFYQKLAETNPLGRIAQPEDIAKFILFLLSDDSNYLNGQVITMDGGYTNQDPTLLIEEEEHN